MGTQGSNSFKVIVRPCSIDPARLRWEIHEDGLQREFAFSSYASKIEALVAGERALQRWLSQAAPNTQAGAPK
jgi:hypothetical protein